MTWITYLGFSRAHDARLYLKVRAEGDEQVDRCPDVSYVAEGAGKATRREEGYAFRSNTP